MAAALALASLTSLASAVEIELNDAAPDRVERQRAYIRGALPLPATPDVAQFEERLKAKGLAKGSPVYIRIFKETSELELWVQKDGAFVLLDTYPICHWTGSLGPKLREGDKQSPEGFYSVGARQMRQVGRWRAAFNIGYPNTLDQLQKRTGSYILVHGGCSSTGCFAMTEAVQNEIYALAYAAVKAGQPRFQVDIFPFRMTDAAMARHDASQWAPFWRDLKAGYDSFERTHVPPKVAVCGQRYHVSDGIAGIKGDPRPLAILKPTSVTASASNGEAEVSCEPEIAREGHQTLATAPAPARTARHVVRGRGGNAREEARRATRKPGGNGLGEEIVTGAPRVVSVGD